MQKERKDRSRAHLKDEDYEGQKKKEGEWKSNSRMKRKNEDPDTQKEENRMWVAKHRSDETEDNRLRNFLDASMYGPIFICICCHGKMFKTNVQKHIN